MNKYMFKTSIRPKEYCAGKIWCEDPRDVIIDAENLEKALILFQDLINRETHITISDNALKHKDNMYYESTEGDYQSGYVITASTDIFDENVRKWKKYYLNAWCSIRLLINPFIDNV